MSGSTAHVEQVERVEFSTTNTESAHEAINAQYAAAQPIRFSDSCGALSYSSDRVSIGGLIIERARLNGTLQTAEMPPMPMVTAPVVLHGRLDLASRQEQLSLGRGDTACYPLDRPWRAAFGDLSVVVVRFPVDALNDVAGADLEGAGGRLYFSSMAPVSPERGRFWRTTFAQVERELRAPDSALVHPLVLTETIRLLAGAALAVFPNPTMADEGHGEPGWVAPAVVRRAVDFIESRADQPIMVGEIAAAAGIGVRALQQAFVRHLGVSPMDYARRVRLARAHQDLVAADPTTGVTVRDIAARWGFARPDRFAAYYRERYGVPPSHSLRG